MIHVTRSDSDTINVAARKLVIQDSTGGWLKNVGHDTLHAVFFELCLNEEMSGLAEARVYDVEKYTDAVKQGSRYFTELADEAGFRILHLELKPGQSTPSHSHFEPSYYVLDGGLLEFEENGEKVTMELAPGDAWHFESLTHKVRNKGQSNFSALIYERNPTHKDDAASAR